MGRIKTYASAAEKMRAYRARQAQALAALRARAEVPPPPPVIVEKVVEKFVTVPTARKTREPTPDHPTVNPEERRRLLQAYFAELHSGGEDAAKRLRVNGRKAATTARELHALLARLPFAAQQALAADQDFLAQAITRFEHISAALEGAQRGAARAAIDRQNKLQEDHEARLKTAALELFGEPPDPATVTALITDLLAFVKSLKVWARAHHGVDNALMDLDDFSLKQAQVKGNVTLMARAVAEARLSVPARGRRLESQDTQGASWWHAGWDDFMDWRATR
jgi:hypothetical protein